MLTTSSCILLTKASQVQHSQGNTKVLVCFPDVTIHAGLSIHADRHFTLTAGCSLGMGMSE